jgi:hypothetical protein
MLKNNSTTLLLGLVIMLAVSMTGTALAARNTIGVSWSLSVPTGDTRDFVKNVSWRGINLEYKGFFREDASWGFNAGYNVFAQDQDKTFVGENFAVTGNHHTYINTVPLYLSGHRYFGNRRDGRFFVGMNAGTAWLEQRRTLGLYEVKESNWHLGLAPEVGYNFPWNSFLGFASLRFNYLLEAGDVPSQSWFELKLGFGLD